MPLILAPMNVELTIMKILVDDKTKRHLESLGITINSKIMIISRQHGSTICQVKEGRLALDGEISRHILVAWLGGIKLIVLLKDFKVGQEGVIKTVNGEGRVRRRLFDMGVTPGANVVMRKKAPLGDPIEVTIRGYELTLRKDEAQLVEMEIKEEESNV